MTTTMDEKNMQAFKNELNGLLEDASDAGLNVIEANNELEDAIEEVAETNRLFRNELRKVADRIDEFLSKGELPFEPVVDLKLLGSGRATTIDDVLTEQVLDNSLGDVLDGRRVIDKSFGEAYVVPLRSPTLTPPSETSDEGRKEEIDGDFTGRAN